MTTLTFVAGANQFLQMENALRTRSGFTLRKIDVTRTATGDLGDAIRRTQPDIVVMFMVSQHDLGDLGDVGEFVVSVGKFAPVWKHNTVTSEQAKRCYEYLLNGGTENYGRFIDYITDIRSGGCGDVPPAIDVPFQGLVDPDVPGVAFQSLEEYKSSVRWTEGAPSVGLIVSREAWLAERYQVTAAVRTALRDEGLNTVILMSKPKGDPSVGAMGTGTAMYHYLCRDGKFLLDAMAGGSYSFGDVVIDGKKIMTDRELASLMDVPIFGPINLYKMTKEEWLEGKSLGASMPSHIILPEYEGIIEPMLVGFTNPGNESVSEPEPIPERCRRFASRVKRRLMLARKPNSEKRVVIFMNISACASLESTLGLAHGMSSYQSVVNLLRRMKEEGYDVEVPEDGETLRKMITDRRAFSEYRWTPLQLIIDSGGCLDRLPVSEYRKYFGTLSDKVKEDMVRVWGEPPGEGMVDGDDLIVTGIRFGNAVVTIQPKRGCVGNECSGKVCKYLTEPKCPPSHAYVSTYHYFRDVWKADLYVQMGSHGTLEHLPGRSEAMTGDCYPDLLIGDVPLFYVFNSCDGPNGTLAKRRISAVMVDHPNIPGDPFVPYGRYEELEKLLTQFHQEGSDPAHFEILSGQILDIAKELNLGCGKETDDVRERIRLCELSFSRLRSTLVETSAFTLGEKATDPQCVSIISGAVRFGSSADGFPEEDRDRICRTVAEGVVKGTSDEDIIGSLAHMDEGQISSVRDMIGEARGILGRIAPSDEMSALIGAMSGRPVRPGPAGAISRGSTDVFPTGRNLYILNPFNMPTSSAVEIGKALGDSFLQKYREDNGEYPQEVAFAWLSHDLAIANGEMLAEMLYLIGTEPVYEPSGKVTGVKVIPLEELGRPRIDVMVRATASIPAMFRNCIDLLDKAVSVVSDLDEDPDSNYVRKHTLESLVNGSTEQEAKSRIFSSGPAGASGIFQAMAAGAWETADDLAKIFLTNNGYAFGVGKDGVPMHRRFSETLSGISATFNRIASDERDIIMSANYVSQGGVVVASEFLTGKKVKSYFGDTRNPRDIGVRTLSEEIDRISGTKILNPTWIEAMKSSGYQGATAMMGNVHAMFGWQATTGDVRKEVFDGITEKYVLDDDTRRFIQENNPYALETIERKLLEAEYRGMWKADPETLEKLKKLYLEMEGVMEGISDGGECQGSYNELKNISDDTDTARRIKKCMEDIGRNR